MDVTIVCLLLLLVVLFLYWYSKESEKCDLPGPWGLPVLGYALFIGRAPHKTFAKLMKKYGDVFQVKIGVRRVVVLNSCSAIKEAYTKWEFSDRPPSANMEVLQGKNSTGIAFVQVDEKWKFTRKAVARALQTLSSSTHNRMEQLTFDALRYLKEEMSRWPAEGADPTRCVFHAVNSVIGTLSYSHSFFPEHPYLKKLLDTSDQFSHSIALGAIADYFPFIAPFARKSLQKVADVSKNNSQFVDNIIESHEHNADICDIQDALEASIESPQSKAFWKKLGCRDEDIRYASRDLFFAGTFTTMDHFLSFLRVCAYYPETQAALRAAVLKVSPDKDALITLEFRDKIPYVRAFLEELFRFVTHTPLALPHCTQGSTKFRGYSIPTDTTVVANIWNIHHDPSVFPDPLKFDPNRFLDESGEFDPTLSSFILPFSVGKRKCLGELMARKELFLLISNFIKLFEIMPASFEGKGPFDHKPGLFQRLKPACLKLKLIH